MDSLFPQQRPADATSRQPPALISFKAGKCVVSDRQSNGKFTVTADKRRGTLSMSRSSDGLMRFRWTDRSTGILEDHRIVFPDEVSFKKCKTGRETDRVYLLKFTHAQQPLMFWMQEKSSEKDAENASKINEYANNPAAADAAAAAIASAANAGNATQHKTFLINGTALSGIHVSQSTNNFLFDTLKLRLLFLAPCQSVGLK
jgi:Proteasome complex subunit Rpn13 ubiquitin receptor